MNIYEQIKAVQKAKTVLADFGSKGTHKGELKYFKLVGHVDKTVDRLEQAEKTLEAVNEANQAIRTFIKLDDEMRDEDQNEF